MKWLGRFFVFGACLLAGIAATFVLQSAGRWTYSKSPELFAVDTASDQTPTGLRITYEKWKRSEMGPSDKIRLTVYNGLYTPVAYQAHIPDAPSPSVRISGKDIDRIFTCGTGIKTYYILPGETVEFEVNSYYFTRTPRPNDDVTVGFWFKTFGSDKYELHFSEPFQISDDFRQVIVDRRGM